MRVLFVKLSSFWKQLPNTKQKMRLRSGRKTGRVMPLPEQYNYDVIDVGTTVSLNTEDRYLDFIRTELEADDVKILERFVVDDIDCVKLRVVGGTAVPIRRIKMRAHGWTLMWQDDFNDWVNDFDDSLNSQ